MRAAPDDPRAASGAVEPVHERAEIQDLLPGEQQIRVVQRPPDGVHHADADRVQPDGGEQAVKRLELGHVASVCREGHLQVVEERRGLQLFERREDVFEAPGQVAQGIVRLAQAVHADGDGFHAAFAHFLNGSVRDQRAVRDHAPVEAHRRRLPHDLEQVAPQQRLAAGDVEHRARAQMRFDIGQRGKDLLL